jgi:hypothetical protein
LAQKIAEAKVLKRDGKTPSPHEPAAKEPLAEAKSRFAGLANRIGILVGSTVTDESSAAQAEARIMEMFNAQFAHFPDDAPACDICGSITVRNGTCYKCYNCGNSMGCS